MNSTIEVSDIWIEDLFKWFYDAVMDSGGDGDGVIVCENYKEAADMFVGWWNEKIKPTNEWFKEREFSDIWEKSEIGEHEKFPNMIIFSHHEESFQFTNNVNVQSWEYMYKFIVRGDCGYAFRGAGKKLIRIPNV